MRLKCGVRVCVYSLVFLAAAAAALFCFKQTFRRYKKYAPATTTTTLRVSNIYTVSLKVSVNGSPLEFIVLIVNKRESAPQVNTKYTYGTDTRTLSFCILYAIVYMYMKVSVCVSVLFINISSSVLCFVGAFSLPSGRARYAYSVRFRHFLYTSMVFVCVRNEARIAVGVRTECRFDH